MAQFLEQYLFHWTPDKAVWLGGPSLSWDARCAGIYAGFAVGLLCQLALRWKSWPQPSGRLLAACAPLAAPLFVDVLANAAGIWPASNDARFATGLLFGNALSLCLAPAFASLFDRATRDKSSVVRYVTLPLVPSAAVFLLTAWDSVVAYVILESLCVSGFLALAAILAVGAAKAAWSLARDRTALRGLLVVALLLLGGCAASPGPRPSDACDAASFVAPRPAAACGTEVCRGGKVSIVEDLTLMSPVDDWAEEKFCLRHPLDCLRAYPLKDKTEQWQKSLMGKYWTKKDIRNGLYDAARHAHLMCVYAERFGADFARGLGIAHEEDSEYLIFSRKGAPSNPCCEKVMDLYNNEIGIMLATRPGSCEDKVLGSLHLLRHSLCEPEKKINY